MNRNDLILRSLLLEAQNHPIGIAIECSDPGYCYARLTAIRKQHDLVDVFSLHRRADGTIWIINRAQETGPSDDEEDT